MLPLHELSLPRGSPNGSLESGPLFQIISEESDRMKQGA